MKNPRLAIIGCGAVVTQFHVPALKKLGWKPAVCIDPIESQAESVARKFKTTWAEQYTDVLDKFDAALISAPPAMHKQICTELLKAGKYVLVEKPMALTHSDCTEMIAAQKYKGKSLLVGLMRRYFHAGQWLQKSIQQGMFGTITEFKLYEGGVFSWPVASDAIWNKKKAGGGVLLDTGSHSLDQLLWLLGDFSSCTYADDSYGGVESDASIDITLKSGAKGHVELSRTRDLGATLKITGTLGSCTLGLTNNNLTVHVNDPSKPMEVPKFPKQSFGDLSYTQFSIWLAAINSSNEVFISGDTASLSIRLIEHCYNNRTQLQLPWMKSR